MRSSAQGLRSVSNNRWRLLLPALAIVALGFLGMGAGSASAGDEPLVASISGKVTGNNDGTFTLSATGFSSQLGGNINYTGLVQITSVIPPDSGPPDTIALADTLTETLILANGDTLTLLCLQSAVRISPDAAGFGLSIVYRGSDRWSVSNGTGQFKNARGAGTGDTYVDLTSGTFIKVLSGTITKVK